MTNDSSKLINFSSLIRKAMFFLLAAALLFGSCKATQKRNKPPKPGEPIPCPIKDC
ncbi:hypothetical protein OO013_01195 [Mangrovivirga sp. M17]|uniref:Lipoprotein n=1 Tax=Mangrovivirga halotolerans TaxID=2993936 RepID=A0ABT3RKW7_9BACT|nr:hypothetical protein [Mangrovivirga halotolerans]MCX2742457.1 hypothetical protein [Mangrovivirga halotolerans]